MSNFQLPEPTTGYRLPDGRFVSTPEEYVAEMTKSAAERMARAYVHHNRDSFSAPAQATRAINSVTAFLQWQAVETHKGTLNAAMEAYDAAVAAEAAAAQEPEQAQEAA